MNCAACGSENPDRAKFCMECAAPLQAAPTAPTASPPAERHPRDYTPRHLADQILQSRSALEGERKQVTVLFCDVKGSMELAESLDPEDWHAILDRFFEILSEGVHRFEGTVNQYTGDGIMALFGAPIAHEDHVQRACHAALRLREELRGYANRLRIERGLHFGVRLGLNSGQVVVGRIGDDLRMDYTAQGHVVGVAARLQEIAEPGQVYLGPDTAAHARGYFELEELGPRRVRGVDRELALSVLRGPGAIRTRLELSRARGFSRFVGRADEMAQLDAAFERSQGGGFEMVAIVGEAGLGKSRLCHEFCERVRAGGFQVAVGQCVSHGANVPLLPWMSMLRSYFDLTDRDAPELARDKVTGRWVRLGADLETDVPFILDFMGIPDPVRPVAQMTAETRRRRLLEQLVRMAAMRGRASTMVQVWEDLHWSDASTESLLLHAYGSGAYRHTLVILNYRPEYRLPPVHGIEVQRLELRPLEQVSGEELLADLLGADLAQDELAAAILKRAGGNPFFVEEIVQSLVESGTLCGSRGAYERVGSIEAIAIPDSARAVLAARIDRLADDQKGLLQAASIIGRQFAVSHLAELVESSAHDVEVTLRGLTELEFVYQESVVPELEYAFKHPLTQEVVYESQLGGRRRTLHARLAEVLREHHRERLDENAALLAHHLEQAECLAEAVAWHARAAKWVVQRDLGEGLRHWRHVVELGRRAPSGAELDALRLEGCWRFLSMGGWRVGLTAEEVERLFDEGEALARRLDDPAPHALLLGAKAGRLSTLGRTDEGVDLYRRALALVRDRDVRATLMVGTTHSLAWSGRLEECLRSAREQRALCDGDTSAGMEEIGASSLLHGFLLEGLCLALFGRLDDAREISERGLAVAREADQREAINWHLGFCTQYAYWAGDRRGLEGHSAEHAALEACEIAERIGLPHERFFADQTLGLAHLQHDRPGDAVACLERSIATANEHQTPLDMVGVALACLPIARLAAGDLHGAQQAAREAVAITAQRNVRSYEAAAHVALARTLLASALLDSADGGEAGPIEAALEAAEALVAETGARVLSPQIAELRGELASLRGDVDGRARLLREAHALYLQVGARGHAERLTRELEAAQAPV